MSKDCFIVVVRRRQRVLTLWNTTGKPCQTPGFHCLAHGLGHHCGPSRPGHCCCEQYSVTPELHGDDGIGRRADTGVKNDWYVHTFHDEFDVVWVANAESAAYRCTQWHYG